MKVALVSTIVPFVDGGARQIVEWLEENLRELGHAVERVYLPQHDVPSSIVQQMAAYRAIDLDAADRVICFRPQAHLIQHPAKVLWFIHHLRVFYDLWDSPWRPFPDNEKHRGIRAAIVTADNKALAEARAVFTNSKVVGERLRRFNGVDSEVLYPPVFRPERFRNDGHNDEIVYVARLEPHKRQHLLVEALAHTTTQVKVRLCGTATGASYPDELRNRARELGVLDRLTVENRWITEEEKADALAACLGSAYLPVDEDSYGYPTLEAAHSGKPTITTTDSGGVLEFVEDSVNGLITEPAPEAVAAAMDRMYLDRARTREMGQAASLRIAELGIDWPLVVERLLA